MISEIARAKVNFRLKFEGRRDDGYHLLSMINVTHSMHDILSFDFNSTSFKFICESDSGIAPSFEADNIATLAARNFFEKFNLPGGVRISLKKNIPIGAGLGGGSSDAAAVLRACMRNFANDLKRSANFSLLNFYSEVYGLALTLGADVPFFLKGGVARVRGIGERVSQLTNRDVAGWPIFIVNPGRAIDTKQFYIYLRETYPNMEPKLDPAQLDCSTGENSEISMRELQLLMENDFQRELGNFAPWLATTMEPFQALCGARVCLTGSGSCFFVLPSVRTETNSILGQVKELVKSTNCTLFESNLIPEPSPIDFCCPDLYRR